MTRYAAFLRGVSPTNAKMPELKRAFELAGFGSVRTVLSSGNVAFDAAAATEAMLVRGATEAMHTHLGRSFPMILRSMAELDTLLAGDPFARFDLQAGAKRVVTFLREPPGEGIALPVERDGARILSVVGREAFTAYVPSPSGPVFMTLIERTFGRDVTTRTWDTVAKVVRS